SSAATTCASSAPRSAEPRGSVAVAAAVLVVAAPPAIGRRLRPAGRRVLPALLTAERRQVEQAPQIAQRLDAAVAGEVGPEDVVAVAQEDAQAEHLAFGGGAAEIAVEVACRRGHPRHRPAGAQRATKQSPWRCWIGARAPVQ